MYNFNNENKEVKIVITDSEAYSHIESIEEACKMFNISSSFLLESNILATIYVDGSEYMQGEVISSTMPKNLDRFLTNEEEYLSHNFNDEFFDGDDFYDCLNCEDDFFNETLLLDDVFAVNEFLSEDKYDGNYTVYDFAKETSQEELLNEAKLIIDKVKNESFNSNNLVNNCYEDIGKYYEIIEDDFNVLFTQGEKVKSLFSKFSNSSWVKIIIDCETYFLGKVYDKGNKLKYVAVGIPRIASVKTRALGSQSSFVNIEGLEEFGYEILFQDAESGKALRL